MRVAVVGSSGSGKSTFAGDRLSHLAIHRLRRPSEAEPLIAALGRA